MKKRPLFEAIATLSSTTIGAGILSIPYVIVKAGFFTGLVLIIVLGIVVLFMNLFLGEITLRTKGNHQLSGYASIYLGKFSKYILTISMMVGIYGALIAYLIGEGQTLGAIFSINPLIASLIFFVIVSTIVFFGLRAVKSSELFMMVIVLAIVILIFFISFDKINLNNLTGFSLGKILLPYGVVLFAFLAQASIPEMKEELTKERKQFKKAIIIGTLIPLVVYILFVLIVIGITGIDTTQISTIGLGNFLGEKILIIGNLFAVFAMATSFLTLGLALREMYSYDYKINKNLAWVLTCFIPLGLFLIGIRNFIETISIAGAVAGGLDGILIALILWKAKKHGDRKPEFSIRYDKIIGAVLIIVFVIGLIYTLIHL